MSFNLLSNYILVWLWNTLLIPAITLYVSSQVVESIQLTYMNLFYTIILMMLLKGSFNLLVIFKPKDKSS